MTALVIRWDRRFGEWIVDAPANGSLMAGKRGMKTDVGRLIVGTSVVLFFLEQTSDHSDGSRSIL